MPVPHSPQEAVAEAAGSQHEESTKRDDAGRRDAKAPAGQPGPHNAPKAGGIGRRVRHLLSVLGPGVITGASDDDPSGIGTYSVAGAQFGYGTVWTCLVTFPLSAAVQEVP